MKKIAITSEGNHVGAKLDKRFGHCNFFIIYDLDSQAMEIIPNPYRNNEEQAGTNAAGFLCEKGVCKVISGEFGLKVKPIFDAHQVQLIIYNHNITVERLIKLLNH